MQLSFKFSKFVFGVLLFGVCFILHFLKLPNVYDFGVKDKDTHIKAKDPTKTDESSTQDVYRKFVRWKNIKNQTPHERITYYTKNLNSAINKGRS